MTLQKHILFLCGWYPSRVLPTNGDFIQRHAEAVSLHNKVSVLHIITDKSLQKDTELTYQKINNVHTYISYVKPTKNPVLKVFLFIKTFKKLMELIGEFDVIHLNKMYPFGIFTFFNQKPYVITEHWTGYLNANNEKVNWLHKLIGKIIAKRAKYLCPVSKDLANAMINLGFDGNYNIVPNVVDTELFKPQKKNKSSSFTILHVSNMIDSHKNVSGLLKAVSKLNFDYKLILLGDGSHKYLQKAAELGIKEKVECIQHVTHNHVPDYFNKADIFVLFSNYENLPCVILESFSCGTPVISTDVGGIKEHFPEKFGFLIPKNNQKLLIQKLEEVYNNYGSFNPEEMHNYAVNNFSKVAIANAFNNLYKSIT